ncbi:MAG TPA: DUF6151 family protein [Nannocystaceae bacterium]|nr:DUF6151 family protein [Nannocystaceae bacterium]
MSTELALRCRCGKLRGAVVEVARDTCSHAVCYCRDCQAFARWLGIDGVMNERGGTEIIAVAQGRVRWHEGGDRLRCMRLSAKGTHRWYSECCRTPVGNTISARIPFVGIARMTFVDAPEQHVGPAIGMQGRYAKGGVPEGVHARAPLGLVAHSAKLVFGWWVRGKARPSDYFDAKTGAAKHEPLVLAAEERAQLDRDDAG